MIVFSAHWPDVRYSMAGVEIGKENLRLEEYANLETCACAEFSDADGG